MDAQAVGQRIKAAREAKGLTQEGLAALVDLSPTHVSVIERGLKIPNLDSFVAIANALGVSADSLLIDVVDHATESAACALPGFVDSKNEEKTERNAGYLVVSHSGGGMLRQGTRKGIRRTPANRGMRAHRIVKSLDISEDVCHGLCP